MGWRKVEEEYEADLLPVPKPKLFGGKKGKLERKTYADGQERLKIRFRKVALDDGSAVQVVIDGSAVCELEVADGSGRADLRSEEGARVPSVREGSVVEIQHQGQPYCGACSSPTEDWVIEGLVMDASTALTALRTTTAGTDPLPTAPT